MTATCVDVNGKDGNLTFSIDCPISGRYQLIGKIREFTISESIYRKDMLLFSPRGRMQAHFIELFYYDDMPEPGRESRVVCYIGDSYVSHNTSHAVWDKVVALLSNE